MRDMMVFTVAVVMLAMLRLHTAAKDGASCDASEEGVGAAHHGALRAARSALHAAGGALHAAQCRPDRIREEATSTVDDHNGRCAT